MKLSDVLGIFLCNALWSYYSFFSFHEMIVDCVALIENTDLGVANRDSEGG